VLHEVSTPLEPWHELRLNAWPRLRLLERGLVEAHRRARVAASRIFVAPVEESPEVRRVRAHWNRALLRMSACRAGCTERQAARTGRAAGSLTSQEDDHMSELNEKQRDRLDDDQYAFPKERKEPLNDADHVRNAVARFNQVEGVSDSERDEAWKRIKKAAKKHDVELSEKSWRELKD
jgi:hypothetical protein